LKDWHGLYAPLLFSLLTKPDWVHRRVDQAAFVDPTTIRRRRSVDFTLPALTSPAPQHGTRDVHYVPLTLINKWRLVDVDVRDEAGVALGLVGRRDHGPLAAALLIMLAHFCMGDTLPPRHKLQMPDAVKVDLRRIANAKVDDAVRVCSTLLPAEPLPDDEMEWRTTLALNRTFMGLAWDLARSFFVMVPLTDAAGTRRVIKLGYNYRVTVPSSRKMPRKKQEEQLANGVGAVLLRSERVTESKAVSDTPRVPAPVFRLRGPGDDDTERIVIAKNGDEVLEANLPVGHWRIWQDELPGFTLMEKGPAEVEVSLGEIRTVTFVNNESLRKPEQTELPSHIPRLKRRIKLAAEVGLRAREYLIPLRVGDGGSYHLEFEAPEGFTVTRAKIATADHGGDVLDLVTDSAKRTHLYLPYVREPTAALAKVHLRPRSDTIVDTAMTVAIITALVLCSYAVFHAIHPGDPTSATVVLLATPGALAAFAAHTPTSTVVSRLTSGLRLLALAPGLFAFGAAATITAWPTAVAGRVVIGVLAGGALGLAALWATIGRLTRHPPEQTSRVDQAMSGDNPHLDDQGQ
jgi:hypothetical protein